MCGIFGYFTRHHISIEKVVKLLEFLESHQYEGEKNPIGRHGAGICFLDEHGNMVIHKTDSLARHLLVAEWGAKIRSRIILGHVRRASEDFLHTVGYPEATQPYKVNCFGFSEIISTHNGKVENYMEIRQSLSNRHYFQSEDGVGLVDSEVIPHLFEERLGICSDEVKAAKYTIDTLRGGNTVVIISEKKGIRTLHVLHKGKTRGMYVWKNKKKEIILCSRKEPVQHVLKETLKENNFEIVLSINWNEDKKAHHSFELSNA